MSRNTPTQVSFAAEASFFQGPFPPPELLEHYERAFPGAAERIFSLTEKQSAHRRQLENWAVKGGTILSFLGVICGLIIGLVGLYVSWQVAVAGFPWTAVAIAALDLGGLVSVFIFGTQVRRQERERRDQRNRELTKRR